MKSFARITSIIFVGLGLLIILGGVLFAVSGVLDYEPSTSGLLNMSGMLVLVRMVGGGAISLQGFLLAAIGEVIWLLVDIANSTERTGAYFAARMRRESE